MKETERTGALELGLVAARLGAALDGDPAILIDGIAAVEAAGPSQITFITNPR